VDYVASITKVFASALRVVTSVLEDIVPTPEAIGSAMLVTVSVLFLITSVANVISLALEVVTGIPQDIASAVKGMS
jgi:hypothetical protein